MPQKNIVTDILEGKLPEVPLTITLDDTTILKLAAALLIVSIIVILFGKLIHQHK